MSDGIGLAEKMLGLPGLVVLEVDDVPGEVVVRVESTRSRAVCPSCRRRAQAQDRVEVHLRDQHCFGRPCRLVINKRRWRCRTARCVQKTWTEKIPGVAPRQVLTVRAGTEVTRQVGQLCRSVASVADEYGVGWDTAWAAVELHGTPLVDNPRRVGRVRALGVDEHSYLSATPAHTTIYATSLVDLDRRIVVDLFEGKSAAKLRRWCAGHSVYWLKGVRVVALDLTDTYRSGLQPHLSHAKRVADPFHVTRVANRTLDQVCRRVQNETLGHRGARSTRSFASASSCSKETSVSTSGAGTRCWRGCASATPTTRYSAHGWPKKLCAASISWTTPTRRPCCSTTPLRRVAPTRWPRSAPWVTPCRAGEARS